jgi:(1->4)-alpha-D-glucan 1-alpha-D-glucosylmutase
VEEEKVFNRVHSLLFDLVRDKTVTGLRIDHIDGLYDPTAYLKRLRERTGEDPYVVVEKILSPGERLPDFWPVEGTTGYDFLKAVNGIFCREKNERLFEKIYSSFTGLRTTYDDVLYEKRKLIAEKYMIGDADNIAHLFKRILSKDRHGSDLTIYGLKRAFIEILALFPVYRTYTSQGLSRSSDPSFIQKAAQKARWRNPGLLQEINFIEKVLLLQFGDYLSEKEKAEWLHFVMRFQQFTGPNMAKGLEDTTLYVYNRLLSLNEVGGNPGEFGTSLEAFHDMNRMRVSGSPHAMNATSTHDTKRGEDGRARINVLSEIPWEWEKRIKAWSKMNRKRKKKLDHQEVPDRNDEYFLYQTLIGAFPPAESGYPAFVERMKSTIVKSIREAKVHTAWLKPDSAYEDAFVSFVEEILTPSDRNEFLREFIPFQRKVAYYGMFSSLSQALIKMTSPGIPDFYQGSELWDLNLVDPDNRRPVDFERRKKCLSEIADRSQGDMGELLSDLLLHWEDGRIKLFLIFRVLKARRENADLFQKGGYLPLAASGKFADHLAAFARRCENTWAITLCPRFLMEVIQEGEFPLGPKAWGDTQVLIPEEAPQARSSWREVITEKDIQGGRTLMIGDILKDYPAALLVSS